AHAGVKVRHADNVQPRYFRPGAPGLARRLQQKADAALRDHGHGMPVQHRKVRGIAQVVAGPGIPVDHKVGHPCGRQRPREMLPPRFGARCVHFKFPSIYLYLAHRHGYKVWSLAMALTNEMIGWGYQLYLYPCRRKISPGCTGFWRSWKP